MTPAVQQARTCPNSLFNSGRSPASGRRPGASAPRSPTGPPSQAGRRIFHHDQRRGPTEMKHLVNTYTVVVRVDGVPGWNDRDRPEDVQALIQRHLDDAIPHYRPRVEHVGQTPE